MWQPYDDCRSEFTLGATQRKQLLRYLNNLSFIEKFYTPTANHKFHVDVIRTMHYAVARLTDNRSMIHIGGASFTTIAISERYHFECPFIDYENGTYDVIC